MYLLKFVLPMVIKVNDNKNIINLKSKVLIFDKELNGLRLFETMPLESNSLTESKTVRDNKAIEIN